MPDDSKPRVYDGDGDVLMSHDHPGVGPKITLIPDALPSKARRMRIMWGQHLLEDVLAGRYRSLVCAVNADDNARGIIAQLAALLPTSQWDERSITAYAAQFAAAGERVKVLKYDMDMVEVLAVLRPKAHEHLTVKDLASAFEIIAEMVTRQPGRLPSASVSFLGARANKLVDDRGREPAFETILRIMHTAGYTGDVYPSPAMWHVAPVGLYPRYPFSDVLDRLRQGGY